MSVESVTWALKKVKGINPSERLVLCYLADWDRPSGEIFPHVATIAEEIEVNKRTVQRALQTLEDKGLITRRERRRKDGSRTSDRYYIHMDAHNLVPHSDKLSLCEQDQKPHSDKLSPPGDKNDREGVTKTTPHIDVHLDSSPLNPPKGGNFVEEKDVVAEAEEPPPQQPPLRVQHEESWSVADRIREFKPGPVLVNDLAGQTSMSPEFVFWAAARWQAWALESGQRLRSAASNFRRWVLNKKRLEDLKRIFLRETQAAQRQPEKPDLTEDVVFETAEGQAALLGLVGGRFYADSKAAGRILSHEYIAELSAKAAEKDRSDMDDVALRVFETTKEKERLLSQKYLKAERAAE